MVKNQFSPGNVNQKRCMVFLKRERNTVEKVQHVHIIPKRIEDRLTHIALEITGACS